jgi:hypothetical protein
LESDLSPEPKQPTRWLRCSYNQMGHSQATCVSTIDALDLVLDLSKSQISDGVISYCFFWVVRSPFYMSDAQVETWDTSPWLSDDITVHEHNIISFCVFYV